MKKAKILLAEDDEQLGFVLKESLEDAGYEVVLCHDGPSAINNFNKKDTDLCLLDVMLPLKDGLAVARRIRSQSDVVPILFITAKSLEEDKIKGFETGADDFITKPFSLKELIKRIEVFLRRTQKLHAEQVRDYAFGGIRFSHTDLQLHLSDATVTLTQREADLLQFLCQHPNQVIKREEILLNVWGKSDYFLGRSMDVFMAKLRKHFKSTAAINLETIHGVGFRFNID